MCGGVLSTEIWAQCKYLPLGHGARRQDDCDPETTIRGVSATAARIPRRQNQNILATTEELEARATTQSKLHKNTNEHLVKREKVDLALTNTHTRLFH